MAVCTNACVDCGGRTVGESNICGPCFVKGAKRVAHDPVDSPDHYTFGGIECKDAIREMLTEEEFRGWVKGSVVAYLWRERHKGGDLDVSKAAKVLGWLKGEDR